MADVMQNYKLFPKGKSCTLMRRYMSIEQLFTTLRQILSGVNFWGRKCVRTALFFVFAVRFPPLRLARLTQFLPQKSTLTLLSTVEEILDNSHWSSTKDKEGDIRIMYNS